MRVLCTAGAGRGLSSQVPVVLDEVSRVIDRVPELASLFQRALAPGSPAHRDGRTRLVLCGSAFGAMRRLLDGPAALRGRAGLELVLEPFDFRMAAGFWGLASKPRAAFELHAIVGGTPAYVELAQDDRPSDGDVDAWAVRRLLDPSSALFREGRIVVTEDASLGDRQMYWGLLSAIADGHRRWSEIETALGGKRGSLKHALDVAIDAGWVVRRDDPLRAQRPLYELSEPIVRFQRLVVEANSARLAARRRPEVVWNDARPDVAARIYGPHLETLALDWIHRFASPETVGGAADRVGSSRVAGKGNGDGMQLDIAVTQRGPRSVSLLLAVGEVKATTSPMSADQLDRLDSAVERLKLRPPQGVVTDRAVRRLLVSRSGFTSDLARRAAQRTDVELIDLARLYNGQ